MTHLINALPSAPSTFLADEVVEQIGAFVRANEGRPAGDVANAMKHEPWHVALAPSFRREANGLIWEVMDARGWFG